MRQRVWRPWPPLDHDGLAEDGPWQIYRVSDPSGYAVEVGSLSVERHEDFVEATWAIAKPMLPVLLLLVLVVRVTTRSAVAPVKDLAQSLASRNAEDLSPVAGTGLPDEFLSTPRALNHYLNRLRTLREAERQFAANAAHELRTPPAAASAQAQFLVQGRASLDAAQTIADAISQLTAIVARLLQLARAESGVAFASRQTDEVKVVRMLSADHGSGQILFDDGDIEEMRISVDPHALAIMLGNLLDNAQMHGIGPIRVTLRPGPIITVSNPVDPDAAFRKTVSSAARSRPDRGWGCRSFGRSPHRSACGYGLTSPMEWPASFWMARPLHPLSQRLRPIRGRVGIASKRPSFPEDRRAGARRRPAPSGRPLSPAARPMGRPPDGLALTVH